MKIGDIKNTKTAQKYALALLQSAQDTGCLEKINEELIFVTETINTNEELQSFLFSPVIKQDDKKDVITRLFSPHCDKITVDFLNLLADSSRLNIINEILNRFALLYNEAKNIAKPTITSAKELNEEQKYKITEKLRIKLHKTIEPQYCVNPSIIGGLIIENDDLTIDCSLKTKFENIKKRLTKGINNGSN